MISPTASMRATRYEVSCLPEDHPARRHFTLAVVYRGGDRWAVFRDDHFCLSSSDTWDFEPLTSEREKEWIDEHRFDHYTALTKARAQAPLLVVNGFTVVQALQDTAPPEEP